MKKVSKAILGCAFALMFMLALSVIMDGVRSVRAQAVAPPWTVQVTGAHAGCFLYPAATPVQVTYCFATDGIWVSNNGAAYVQFGGGSTTAGVSSFNGRTGAVVPIASDYPPVVSSVNGKIGAVNLTVASQVQ